MYTTESELNKIATLACIKLESESAVQLAHDLSAIMNFVEQLRAVDTQNISPLCHPLDLHQRLRQDNITEKNQVLALGKIAPQFTDNLYLVPKVIEVEK
jgi:aspartyl-tRNA(Asn)/glutamyl-tRNA(Gln) amidotransferase subunit C